MAQSEKTSTLQDDRRGAALAWAAGRLAGDQIWIVDEQEDDAAIELSELRPAS